MGGWSQGWGAGVRGHTAEVVRGSDVAWRAGGGGGQTDQIRMGAREPGLWMLGAVLRLAGWGDWWVGGL